MGRGGWSQKLVRSYFDYVMRRLYYYLNKPEVYLSEYSFIQIWIDFLKVESVALHIFFFFVSSKIDAEEEV